MGVPWDDYLQRLQLVRLFRAYFGDKISPLSETTNLAPWRALNCLNIFATC